MDESGMPLDHKPPKVITNKGAKKVYCRTSGNKTQITVIGCGNAAGNMIPPMVIFEGQRFNVDWSVGEVPGTLYAMSEKGWTDRELFGHWMRNLFIPSIPSSRPVLLLLDGHSSHYEPETIRLAAENQIIIFTLPPHLTHRLQPLDISVFGPLKTYWSQECHEYMQNHPGRVVTKYQFSSLFAKAWYKAVQLKNVASGFCKAGICPFDSSVVVLPSLPPPVNAAEAESSPPPALNTTNAESSPPPPVNFTISDCSLPTPSQMSRMQVNNDGCTLPPILSKQKLQRFETRFENGFDVYEDMDYVAWLYHSHPDSLPTNVSNLFSSHTSTTDESIPEQTTVTPSNNSPSASESLAETRKTISVISQFLTYPQQCSTPRRITQRSNNTVSGPRVLTSTEALVMLEKKELKKQEEILAKERKKKEREEKRMAKLKEKERKAIVREERRKIVELNKSKKADEREKNKTELRRQDASTGLLVEEIDNNECAVCLGVYEDDFNSSVLLREWVQCTNADCCKWMHADCLQKNTNDLFVCICSTEFM